MNVLSRMAVATSVLVLAVGCASGEPAGAVGQSTPDQSTPDQSTAVPPNEPQGSSDQTISVRISQGRVEGVPAQVEVNRGTRVRIEVTTDRNDELHVHGYDKTVPLASGSPATVEFMADVPGVFEVETHGSGLLLFQLVVRE